VKKNSVQNISNANFSDILGEKYLAYALSTIMSRSLPDVRDGLKPVHRRLLYAMHQLRLRPEEGFKKCARVVGDVIGKYHPHGDTAVYETLVRLAQNFSLRYPLIEGQGNFGSIDGDNAAAMRYTESRLTKIAMKLLEDLEKDTVNFRPTYDDSDSEPSLFPAMFPNLLTNGAEGIAVGMATSIPPHNLEELLLACIRLIDTPNATVNELLEIVEGPDFPTGGVLYDSKENIKAIYASGRGAVKIRSKWEVEQLGHGQYQIIVTEIPYQVQKSRLIEQIANLLRDKKIPLISNIKDESAEDIRIVIEPKSRSTDSNILMESLFKLSDLESRFNYNLNVISSNNIPKVMNLKEILEEFIKHRFVIVTRRSLFEKNKIESRLEILEGLKVVYLNLDLIIKIIRDEDEPKPVLIKTFSLTENQAEAILNTRLRSLRKLEEQAINAECAELEGRRKILNEILQNEKTCFKVIKSEFKELIKEFGKNTTLGARRTIFTQSEGVEVSFKVEAFVEKEPITVIYSKEGWIRAVKGTVDDIESIKFKEGDSFKQIIKCYTTDYLIAGTRKGKFYTVFADNITKGKGFGEPLKLMFESETGDEVISLRKYNENGKFIICSTEAKGFITSHKDVFAQTKLGKHIMTLKEDVEVLKVLDVGDGQNKVACVSSARKLVVFDIKDIPELKKGQGVMFMKLKDSKLSDIQIFNDTDGFKWTNKKDIKIQKNFEPWVAKRASSGKLPPFGFSKQNIFGEINE
jgi:topoisomerase IV subunit A